MSVAIKPLEDRILVQPLDAEQKTQSGLVIPDTAKEKLGRMVTEADFGEHMAHLE